MLVHKCLVNNLYFFPICLLTIHENHIYPILKSYKVDFAHSDTPSLGAGSCDCWCHSYVDSEGQPGGRTCAEGLHGPHPEPGKGDPGPAAEVLGNSDPELSSTPVFIHVLNLIRNPPLSFFWYFPSSFSPWTRSKELWCKLLKISSINTQKVLVQTIWTNGQETILLPLCLWLLQAEVRKRPA